MYVFPNIALPGREVDMSQDMTKPTKWVCAQKRLRSAWSESSLGAQALCCFCHVAAHILSVKLGLEHPATSIKGMRVQSRFRLASISALYNQNRRCPLEDIWAASWQNQQNGCAPSEDSDQPGHPPSLIRVFTVCMVNAWVIRYPLSAQRRLWSAWADAQADLSLISLGGCPGWSESSLGAQPFCWFCHEAANLSLATQ